MKLIGESDTGRNFDALMLALAQLADDVGARKADSIMYGAIIDAAKGDRIATAAAEDIARSIKADALRRNQEAPLIGPAFSLEIIAKLGMFLDRQEWPNAR